MTKTSTPRVVAALAAVVLVAGLLPASALERPTKEQIERYKLDGTMAARVARAKALGNHKIPQLARERLNAKLARVAGGRPSLAPRTASAALQAPPSGWRGLPTRGTVKVLALLISFSDNVGMTPVATIESRLFGAGAGSPPYDSLKSFYQRSSYDQLTIGGNVLGWYQTTYARSTVAETDAGRQDVIKEALNYYEALGHDFSQYDNDGDGTIDYFCVFWAGPHGEWAEFWWGYYTWFTDTTYRLDGKRLTNYSWQWELYGYPSGSFTPSTIIHETGHALGAPDLYDYDDAIGPRGGVGGLDIMDGDGDHNAFTKFMFDWLTPTVVSSGSQTVTLRASGLYPDAALFMPGASGGIFGEYFVVQNRARAGNDTGLFTGSDGLVIWHIDSRLNGSNNDFLFDNSYTDHKLVRLMEADGLEEIETWAGYADAGDYYRAGTTFGPLTLPNSSRYDGAITSMVVSGITGATTPMSATITSSDTPPTASIVSPAPGATVYGTIGVDVVADDDNGVARVELYGGSLLVQALTAPPFDFSLDTTLFPNGSFTVRAIAYDALGLTGDDSVTLTLANLFPPVNLKAARLLNRSLLFREYVNVLTWADDSRNSGLTAYRIYQSTGGGWTTAAEVPRGVGNAAYRYLHRRVDPDLTYVYQVVGIGPDGREGIPATATARK